MLKKIQTYIEQEPWEETVKRQQRRLDIATLAVIALAAIYFAPAIIDIITR